MLSLKERHVKTGCGSLHGGIKGAAVGAAASLGTGAAVIVTAPAWLPLLGGSALIAGSTVLLWSLIGGGLGASVTGARAYLKHKRRDEAFNEAFPAVATEKEETR